MKNWVFLIAVCVVSDALQMIRPGAEWRMTGESYVGIQWLDKTQTKPTKKEVTDAIAACEAKQTQERSDREQAKIDLNTKAKTDTERIDALIKYLGLDK